MSIDKSQFTIINNDIEISGSMPGVTNSKGGYRQVGTIADRDAIDISYRVKGMLVYVSEIDELRNQNKKLERELKNITKEVKSIRATIVNYANLKDTNMRTLVSGYEKNE